MPPKPQPDITFFDSLTVTDDGAVTFLAAKPLSDSSSFEGYLIPYYALSDRGTFFVPGSAKQTAKEQLKKAPHLWQHDTWEPIGHHVAADADDPKGFRIAVQLTNGIQRADELMMNLRSGVPLGLSVGFDVLKGGDRAGTEDDDKLLNRKVAPDYLRDVPISELRAITAFRWWESSSVTFPGIGNAKPDVIHSQQVDLIRSLLHAVQNGTATEEQLAHIDALVTAYEASPAPGPDQSSDELAARGQLIQINALRARITALVA